MVVSPDIEYFKEETVMTCLEMVILTFVIGLVAMVGICVIVGAISKLIDVKTKSRIELATAIFKNEMEYMDKLFDKYFTRIEEMVDKIVDKN